MDPPLPSRLLRASNVVAFAAFVAVNALAPSNADISRKYETPITPAPWAFAIWGAIFLLQGAGVVWAALPAGDGAPAKRLVVNTVGYGWQATWLCEAAWQLLFPTQTRASFLGCAALLLGGLAAIGVTLARLHALPPGALPPGEAPPAGGAGAGSTTHVPLLCFVLFVLPTSLNAAWMSVASALGLALVAASEGAPAGAQGALGAALAAAVAAAGAWVVLARRDVPYGLTLVWAFGGVLAAIARGQHGGGDAAVAALAAVAGLSLAACCAAVTVRHVRRGRGRAAAAAAAPPGSLLSEALLAGGGDGGGAAR
ncbi:hypothetical protein HT031_005254 [Scenedesmus sp. PABB004]|nr:hypothetical protein HT031_005254 [Scenedesmus sp. PABB004]